jgi:hypothetical protein
MSMPSQAASGTAPGDPTVEPISANAAPLLFWTQSWW